MSFSNEYNENKHILLKAYVKSNSTPTHQTDEGTTGGKGPGQDGWESMDGVVVGPVQASSTHRADNKDIHNIARDIAEAEARRVPRWPDNGITRDDSNIIYPREDDKPVTPPKKIHQFGLSENYDADDQNDWGGISCPPDIQDLVDSVNNVIDMNSEDTDEDTDNVNRDAIGSENEDRKYGPGNYPSDDDYRLEGFYERTAAKEMPPFTWLLPNYLGAGPHPIVISHLDDLTPLKKAGFKAIITLSDEELDNKYLDGFQYLFVHTTEGLSSNLMKVCKFIDTQLMCERPVFIHSLHGKGRAATALAAYLLYKEYVTDAEEAISYVRQNYRANSIGTIQEDALMRLVLDTPS